MTEPNDEIQKQVYLASFRSYVVYHALGQEEPGIDHG